MKGYCDFYAGSRSIDPRDYVEFEYTVEAVVLESAPTHAQRNSDGLCAGPQPGNTHRARKIWLTDSPLPQDATAAFLLEVM